MSGEQAGAADDMKPKSIDSAAAGATRQRSTIAFPYMSLNDAVALASAIHHNVGHGTCSDDQLAAWLSLSPKSSGYRVQMYASRTFGVIEPAADGQHTLTELGRMIVDSAREREGRAKAFLNVPLYRAVHEKYRGGALPPAAALEREMVALGVAEKQKDKARQVFERSAEQAGFFEAGKDRLVMPGFARSDAKPQHPPKGGESNEHKGGNGSGGGGGGGGGGGDELPPGMDPIIVGLIKRMPKPGAVWPEAERKLWLQLLEGSFKLIFKDETPAGQRFSEMPD